jgi:hypothetical protein
MNCEACRRSIDRLHQLEPDQRAALHRHLADCEDCRRRFDAKIGLDRMLDGLAGLAAGHAPPTPTELLRTRKRALQRRIVLALVGAVVAGLACTALLLVDPPFARYALAGTALVMLATAVLSARQASALGRVADGLGGPRQWRDQVRREYRQWSLLGPWVTLLFAALTGALIVRHGLSDPRVAVYLVTALAIAAFCTHGYVVRRPALRRELALIDQLGE